MQKEQIFSIRTTAEFEQNALAVYRHQYLNNLVYKTFCDYLQRTPEKVACVEEIPFLPIDFFKEKTIQSNSKNATHLFTSSGTTSNNVSKHFVTDIDWYIQSFVRGFEHLYGAIGDFTIFALLPSYLERNGSSLVFMANYFIVNSKHTESGFFLNDFEALAKAIQKAEEEKKKVLLLGVSFALLDFAQQFPMPLKNTIIMETGGMKGRRKEITRMELHQRLKTAFDLEVIHSEYGMTELLSQAYSKSNGVFQSPPWMRVLVREPEDPLSYLSTGKTGGLNIIDLANYHSCAFIATQDLGKKLGNNRFEVLGRFDSSDVRGCNLLIL